MADITSANSTLILGINGVLPVPQQIFQFSAEDIFTTEPVDPTETMLSLDGTLNGGFLFTKKEMDISLMASSPSNELFDLWYQTMNQAVQTFTAFGSILIPSLGYYYTLTNGFLSRYAPTSDARKVMMPRRFRITWEDIDSNLI